MWVFAVILKNGMRHNMNIFDAYTHGPKYDTININIFGDKLAKLAKTVLRILFPPLRLIFEIEYLSWS